MSANLDVLIERIGSHIYEDFRVGFISFEVCESSLETLSSLTDDLWLAIPENWHMVTAKEGAA